VVDIKDAVEWKNIARTCERVRAGENISVNVMGGWVSKPAPWDGYVFKSGEAQIYVPGFIMRQKLKGR
jgi:hypothetical protein